MGLLFLALTYNEMMTALPFANTVDMVELQGSHLFELFEFSMTDSYYTLQTSGIRYTADRTKEIGKRVLSLEVLCNECLVPQYEPVDLQKWYRLIVPSYLADGGDGFEAISLNKRSHLLVFRDACNVICVH